MNIKLRIDRPLQRLVLQIREEEGLKALMGMVEMRFDGAFRPLQSRCNLFQLKPFFMAQLKNVSLPGRELANGFANELPKLFGLHLLGR